MTLTEKYIVLVDNDILEKSDAIILLEGDGLNRYKEAVELYKDGWAKRIIFSGAITNYEYGSFPFNDVLPLMLKLGIPREAIIHENRSFSTREQAVEIIKMARNSQWTRLILIGSGDHQYRAYLTFLREVLDSDPRLILYNAPAKHLKWFTDEGWGKRFDRLDQEFERIEKYSSMGHLATIEEAILYQEWKENQ